MNIHVHISYSERVFCPQFFFNSVFYVLLCTSSIVEFKTQNPVT